MSVVCKYDSRTKVKDQKVLEKSLASISNVDRGVVGDFINILEEVKIPNVSISDLKKSVTRSGKSFKPNNLNGGSKKSREYDKKTKLLAVFVTLLVTGVSYQIFSYILMNTDILSMLGIMQPCTSAADHFIDNLRTVVGTGFGRTCAQRSTDFMTSVAAILASAQAVGIAPNPKDMYNYFLDEIQKRLTCKKQSNSNAGQKTPNTNTYTVRSKSSNNNSSVRGMVPSNTQSAPAPRSSRSGRTAKGGYRKSFKRRVSKKKRLNRKNK